MTYTSLIQRLSILLGYEEITIRAFLKATLDTIGQGLVEEKKVNLPRLGKLYLTRYKGFQVKSYKTHELVLTKPRYRIKFKPSPPLKNKVREIEVYNAGTE
jgi:nucleoid DNA-binding protein